MFPKESDQVWLLRDLARKLKKEYIRGAVRKKSLLGNSKIATKKKKKRTVTENVCAKPPSSPSFHKDYCNSLWKRKKDSDSRKQFTQLSFSAKPHCFTSPKPVGRQKCKIIPLATYRNKAQCLHRWGRDIGKLVTNWNKCRVEMVWLFYLFPFSSTQAFYNSNCFSL